MKASLRRLSGRASLFLLTLMVSSCVQLPASKPKTGVSSFQQEMGAPGSTTPTALQAEVMRFADEYTSVVEQASEDFAARAGTVEARQVALRTKLSQATAVIVNASGRNPSVNALDMVVLASVSRMVAEDFFVGEKFGEAAMPLLSAARRMETNAWLLVRSVLKPEQQQELATLIQDWRRKNPNRRYTASIRLQEFAEAAGRAPRYETTKPTSVFSLLFVDPMAGMDPTVRAVEETRYLAERALYYAQRMPMILSWQAEYLALQLADQPAAKQMLTNAQQLTDSLQIFSKTAEQLPQLISQQREAAINQVFVGIATERTNIFASLASEEKKTRELLAEARGTLDAATAMATSVNGAVQSLESFIRYVSPPKTNLTSEPANTNRQLFNVLDYGTAAGQVAVMAKDINTLLTSVNQSVPQAAQLGQQTTANIEGMVRRGFWLGLILIVILLCGSVLASLAYKILANKVPHPERKPPSPEP